MGKMDFKIALVCETSSFIHSLSQQVFSKHLLCARNWIICWENNGEQKQMGSLYHGTDGLVGDRQCHH